MIGERRRRDRADPGGEPVDAVGEVDDVHDATRPITVTSRPPRSPRSTRCDERQREVLDRAPSSAEIQAARDLPGELDDRRQVDHVVEAPTTVITAPPTRTACQRLVDRQPDERRRRGRRRRSPHRRAAASAARPARARAARRSPPPARASRSGAGVSTAVTAAAAPPAREQGVERPVVMRVRPASVWQTHRAMRIWVDLTASAHPVVLRPIVAAPARARPRRSTSPRATTRRRSSSAGCLGSTPRSSARHGGGTRTRKLGALCRRTRRAAALGQAAAASTSPSATARTISRSSRRRWDPGRRHVRLRVGDVPAQRRLPARAAGPGARRDPARAPAPLRRRPGKLASTPAEGGVLPRGLRARRPRCSARLGVDAERVLVVVRPPPDVSLYHRKSNRAVPAGARPPRPRRRRPRARAAAHAEQRERVRDLGLPSLIVPDGAIDGQSARRARRPRRLGRRLDEPRGRRARHAGLHDLRRAPRRRRRAADPRERLRPLSDPRAIELVKRAGPARWSGATRRCSSTSCSGRPVMLACGRPPPRPSPRTRRAPPGGGARPHPRDRRALGRARRASVRAAGRSTRSSARSTSSSPAPSWRRPRRCSALMLLVLVDLGAARCSTAGCGSAARARCSRCTSCGR